MAKPKAGLFPLKTKIFKWCSVDEEFVPDSPLEGEGFEPSVPLFARSRLSSWPKAQGDV
jgi:hypothetical protein